MTITAGRVHRSSTTAASDTSTGWPGSSSSRQGTAGDAAECERLLRGFLSTALFEAGLYCRADDRGDPAIQLAPEAWSRL